MAGHSLPRRPRRRANRSLSSLSSTVKGRGDDVLTTSNSSRNLSISLTANRMAFSPTVILVKVLVHRVGGVEPIEKRAFPVKLPAEVFADVKDVAVRTMTPTPLDCNGFQGVGGGSPNLFRCLEPVAIGNLDSGMLQEPAAQLHVVFNTGFARLRQLCCRHVRSVVP